MFKIKKEILQLKKEVALLKYNNHNNHENCVMFQILRKRFGEQEKYGFLPGNSALRSTAEHTVYTVRDVNMPAILCLNWYGDVLHAIPYFEYEDLIKEIKNEKVFTKRI